MTQAGAGDDVQRKGVVVHQNVPVLRVADGMLMDQLLADKAASACIVRRLSPVVALVEPGSFDKLATRLRKLGHLPNIVEPGPPSPPPTQPFHPPTTDTPVADAAAGPADSAALSLDL